MDYLHRLFLRINLRQIYGNYQKIAEAVAPTFVLPVLKADAYGLGAVAIGNYFARQGVKLVGVADVGEAKSLASVFNEIHILGAVFDDEVLEIAKNHWVCPVTSGASVKAWEKILEKSDQKLRVQLYLDTGMGQLGLRPEEIEGVFSLLQNNPRFEVLGLYSHFSDGDRFHDERSVLQLSIFHAVLEKLKGLGAQFLYTHMGNSSAVNYMPSSYRNFSHIRTGINLYGVQSSAGSLTSLLKSALTLVTRVIHLHEILAGESVGYLHTFVASQRTLVATIPAGYADGVPFGSKNTGYVLIHGKKCKILGRISMDYTSVDVSHLSDVAVGDEVVLIGRDGDNEVSVEDWAVWRQSIAYEVICALNVPRVQKVYIED